MQRCPYIHEMRERLLGQTNNEPLPLIHNLERVEPNPTTTSPLENRENRQNLMMDNNQVGTVVKLNADGYGSHTSPTHQRTPLVPRDLGEDFSLDYDDEPLDPRRPKNANTVEYGCYVQGKKRTSLFIITSLVYAMLLIVVCVAYVISDVSTHKLPIIYYEGFFTYLYGASILFLLYVFCFLLQESSCCNGKPKPPKEKKPKKQKPKKPDPTDAKDGGKDGKGKDVVKGGKPTPFQNHPYRQEVLPKKKRDLVREQLLQKDSTVEAETSATPKTIRKRKTTHTDPSHGSFFLRVGAIAFGLGTMIYVGLEFGTFFETPFTSPCHQILRGVNPLLQMIFTFMQMYFIFMNSRLNIHRFKVLARFGLMHICATNICVWIRTLVIESLKEITIYHQGRGSMPEDGEILESIRTHTLRHAKTVMGTHYGPDSEIEPINLNIRENPYDETDKASILSRMVQSTARIATEAITTTLLPTTPSTTSTTTTTTTTTEEPTTLESTTMLRKLKKFISSSTSTSTLLPTTSDEDFEASTASSPLASLFSTITTSTTTASPSTTTSYESFFKNNIFAGMENSLQYSGLGHNDTEPFENFDALFPAALTAAATGSTNTSCGRINIMGTIVQDSAPYLYPFIIEYSLIGAVVIFVMWRHIGRYPKYTEEDLEHRLEVMLSRRAVAMAQAHSGRVDCVGASKGLFFGLLLLVGSLICLILFFVLVRHDHFSLLAIYLADSSHCALMAFAVFAIFVGFCRVQTLKFRCEEQSNLNDILLRISAFGLFVYSVFSVIAGSLKAFESEPNLLVMVTGILAVVQVVLQLLFIADVSRRRVHLPEHDRSKPGRQIVTFLLIINIAIFAIYTFEMQKVSANPVQLNFYGYIAWSLIQRVTLPLCIFHRFHSAVTLAEIWKTTYKARLE